jgi:hypothetical protein
MRPVCSETACRGGIFTLLYVVNICKFGTACRHLSSQGLQGQLHLGLPRQLMNNLVDVQGDLEAG